MDKQKLINNINKYKETFGSNNAWLAKQMNINRSILSAFLNNTQSMPMTDGVITRIANKFEKLPKSIKFN